jgi:uncharacterized iron-regulated membrane protein
MSDEPLSFGARLARRPQTLLVRRVIFQLHLWVGIALGLYVVMMSVTGSLIVWRGELDKLICPRHVPVAQVGPRLSDAELIAAAHAALPRVRAAQMRVLPARSPAEAVEVWYMRGSERLERLFDPYTGKLLGSTIECEPKWLTNAVELHDHLLLADERGLVANGVGAVLVTLLILGGALLWWPGMVRWQRSLVAAWRGSWQRFAWDLHSATGFWLFLLLLMWTLTGVYLSFPDFFAQYLYGPDGDNGPMAWLDPAVRWLVRLHFGRTFGVTIKVAWVVLGLAPAIMFITGFYVWWRRVVRPAAAASSPAVSRP